MIFSEFDSCSTFSDKAVNIFFCFVGISIVSSFAYIYYKSFSDVYLYNNSRTSLFFASDYVILDLLSKDPRFSHELLRIYSYHYPEVSFGDSDLNYRLKSIILRYRLVSIHSAINGPRGDLRMTRYLYFKYTTGASVFDMQLLHACFPHYI